MVGMLVISEEQTNVLGMLGAMLVVMMVMMSVMLLRIDFGPELVVDLDQVSLEVSVVACLELFQDFLNLPLLSSTQSRLLLAQRPGSLVQVTDLASSLFLAHSTNLDDQHALPVGPPVLPLAIIVVPRSLRRLEAVYEVFGKLLTGLVGS